MAAAKRERTRSQRWRRRVFGGFAGLLVLLALVVVVLHTSWGKDRVRARAEAALGKRVRGSVAIASLDYDFPFGDLRVSGIEIRDAAGEPAIAVDSLGLSVGLWSTMTERLSINSLDVKGLRLKTYIKEDGRNSLRELFIRREGNAKGFVVDSVRVEGLQWEVSKADGDRISLKDGLLQARLSRGEFTELYLDTFSATFSATRGEHISVEGVVRQDGAVLKTNAERTVLSLQPLATTVRVRRDAEPAVESELKVAKGELELTPTSLVAKIENAVLGPLSIGEARATLGFVQGEPAGHQDLQLNELRLDTKTVGALLQRELPVGDAVGQVHITGPLDALVLRGELVTPEGKLGVEGHVDVTGPDAPTYSFSTTSDFFLGALSPIEGSLLRVDSLLPTELRIQLSGVGLPSNGGSLNLQMQGLQTIEGKSSETLNLKAHKEGHSLHVDSLKLSVLGTEIEGGGSMETGEGAGDMTAKFTVKGNAKKALARLEELGLRVSPPLHLPSQLFLDVSMSGSAKERIVVTVLPSETAIAGGKVKLQGEAVFEPQDDAMALVSADGSMSVEHLQIAGLARIARRRAPVNGDISGSFKLRQRGTTRSVTHELRVRIPEKDIELRSRGEMRKGRWRGRIGAHELDSEKELAWLEGTLPLIVKRGLRLRRRGKIELQASVPTVTLQEHAHRLPPELRAKLEKRALDASLNVSLELEGTVQKPKGRLSIAAGMTPRTQPDTNLALDLSLVLEGNEDGSITMVPSGQLAHSGLSEPLLALGGEVRATINRLQPKQSKIHFDIVAEVGKRPVAALASLLPALESRAHGLIGDVSADLRVHGTPDAPMLEANVEIGAGNPLKLRVDAEKRGTSVMLKVQTSAKDLALSDLWPTFLPRLIDEPLLLSSDLGAEAKLTLQGKPQLSSLVLGGTSTLEGAQVAVPKSTRVWRNLRLALRGDGNALRVNFEAVESDEQEEKRTIELEASAMLETGDKVSLGQATARLQTHKWLLFGGILGLPDAPRAALDSDIAIAADLSGAFPVVDVTVNALNYWEPDREVFTHGFTHISPKGDLVFVGEPNRPLGRLGPVLADSPKVVETQPEANVAPKAHIRVHIPKPVSIAKGPLKLKLSGDIEQLVAPGSGPTGQVNVESGDIVFFAQSFPHVESRIVLDGSPKPKVDMFFADEVAPDILRGLSRESSGTKAKIHVRPVGGGPLVSFSGAGNSSMIDTLALLHTGRGYVFSQPDVPASFTVRAPQGIHPLMIAFIKANVPKLDLLQRFGVWSSPFDAHTSFGQLRNLDAERRMGNGASRLRLISRPQQIGRSTSEAHLDRLIIDSDSVSLGVGLRAGTRLGGGVGLFFDWTSAD